MKQFGAYTVDYFPGDDDESWYYSINGPGLLGGVDIRVNSFAYNTAFFESVMSGDQSGKIPINFANYFVEAVNYVVNQINENFGRS